MFDPNDGNHPKIYRSTIRGYAVAVATVAVAAGLTKLLEQGLGSSLFVFFLGSVVISTQSGGYRAGFLAMILTLILSNLLFFEPRWAITFDSEAIRRCSLFAFISVLICALSEGRWRAVVRERRLRRWYEGTLSGIDDAVISTDPSGRIIYLNSMAERLTGWGRTASVGKPLDQVFRTVEESTRAPADDSVERVLREGRVVVPTGSTLLIARDGNEIPIEQSLAPIRDDRRRISGVALVFRDVSDRKQAERDLAESEARFRAFMDHSPIFAFIKDDQGRYVWGNSAWSARHRRPVGALLGRTDLELWPEETARRFRASDLAALETGASVESVEESRSLDGQESRLMTMKFPLRETTGRRLVGGISVDITGRVKAEEALREGEARYRLLFDGNPHPLWVFDVETLRFLDVNESAITRYGYSREEFLAMTVADIRPEEDVGLLRQAVKDRQGRTFMSTTGWRHKKKDGSIIDVEITSTSLDYLGRDARVVLAHDVSERLRAELALQVSRERLDLVLGAANLGVWFSDLPLGVLEWNDQCKEHFGVSIGEPVTIETFKTRLHPDDCEAVLRELEEAIAGRAEAEFEFRTVDAEGRSRWVRSIGRVYRDSDGHPIRFDAVTIDVTASKAGEAELREAKESAEAANRSKDRFLAVLSHELRTPLTPVLATVTAMLDEPDDPIADLASIRPTLEMIRRGVELEARLIDDLLDVSRIVHGKLSLDRAPVDVHELIHQTLGICRSDLNGKRMRLEISLLAKQSIVEADPARLQQVLWNLIKNAVKFTPEGGTVAIRSRDTEPAEDGSSPRLMVQILDSGIGIEPEMLPRIFDAFEQGEGANDRRFGGLGLGLAISRSVVEAHGGTIEAESPGLGQGSSFTISLPSRADVGIIPASPALVPLVEGQPLRILLVEDDLNTLRVLSRLLKLRGYEVTTADNVASAREKFEEADFDLLLSDIGLPDGTGIELMSLLRKSGPLRGVALTGYGMDEDIRRCREAGFIAHLTKPVDFQKLEATIRQVASGTAFG